MTNLLSKIKNNSIYAPRVLYGVVFFRAWFVFRKDFHVYFPSRKIRAASTHFIFIIEDKKSREKYIAKFRNPFSDVYFRRKTKVRRLPKKQYIALLKILSGDPYVRDIMPKVRIYEKMVLWEFLEHAYEVDAPELGLSEREIIDLKGRVDKVVKKLLNKGIIYGKVKKKHVLVEKKGSDFRVVLIDWDTARYA